MSCPRSSFLLHKCESLSSVRTVFTTPDQAQSWVDYEPAYEKQQLLLQLKPDVLLHPLELVSILY